MMIWPPARSSRQEVFPPYCTVLGPGVGIEPRTPQNFNCSATGGPDMVNVGAGCEFIVCPAAMALRTVRMMPWFPILAQQFRCRQTVLNYAESAARDGVHSTSMQESTCRRKPEPFNALIESLCRNWHRGPQFLRKKRNFELFEQPPKFFQVSP